MGRTLSSTHFMVGWHEIRARKEKKRTRMKAELRWHDILLTCFEANFPLHSSSAPLSSKKITHALVFSSFRKYVALKQEEWCIRSSETTYPSHFRPTSICQAQTSFLRSRPAESLFPESSPSSGVTIHPAFEECHIRTARMTESLGTMGRGRRYKIPSSEISCEQGRSESSIGKIEIWNISDSPKGTYTWGERNTLWKMAVIAGCYGIAERSRRLKLPTQPLLSSLTFFFPRSWIVNIGFSFAKRERERL